MKTKKETLTAIFNNEFKTITGIVKFIANNEAAQKRIHQLHDDLKVNIPVKSFSNKKFLLDEFKRIDTERAKKGLWLLSETKDKKTGELVPRVLFTPSYVEIVLRANRTDK